MFLTPFLTSHTAHPTMTHNNIKATFGHCCSLTCQKLSCPFSLPKDWMAWLKQVKLMSILLQKSIVKIPKLKLSQPTFFCNCRCSVYLHPLLLRILLTLYSIRPTVKWKRPKEKKEEEEKSLSLKIAFPFCTFTSLTMCMHRGNCSLSWL